MKKILIAILFTASLFISNSILAQDEGTEQKKGFDPNKLFFGGSFGLSFGDYTLINVSPQAGYRFNKYFAAGAGVNFISSSYKVKNYNGVEIYKDQYGYAGLNIFGRVYPIPFLFAQVQPELNYSWGKTKFSDPQIPEVKLESRFVPSLLVGGGAAIPTGARGAFIVSLFYDLVQDARSPYGTKMFMSIGYNF